MLKTNTPVEVAQIGRERVAALEERQELGEFGLASLRGTRLAVGDALPAGEPSGVLPPPMAIPSPGVHAQNNGAGNVISPEPLFEDGGRFRIIRHLGKGAMGDVYLANDNEREELVALKILGRAFRDDPAWRDHLRFQAAVIGRISHVHIAAIHELVEDDAGAFLVMEYVDGVTLRERLRDRMSVSDVLRMAVQCTEALGAAHTLGIVHHDVKPENIMLTREEGSVKVCDFGVARPLPGVARRYAGSATAATQAATPAYVAPEVLLGEEADGRADIFSLGIVLYEALARRHPFSGAAGTPPSVERSAPEPARRLNPQVPASLEVVVSRMLETRPAERFSSAADLVKALSAVQHTLREQESVDTQPLEHIRVRGPSTVRWRRWIPHTILVLAIGLMGMLWSPRPAALPDLKSVVVLPFTSADQSPGDRAYCAGFADILTARLTRFTSSAGLQVVPGSEVRVRAVTTASDARRELGATLVVEGHCTNRDGATQVALLLRDAQTATVLRRRPVAVDHTALLAANARILGAAARMLGIEIPDDDRASSPKSAEAYRLYLRGRGLLVEYAEPNNIDASIDAFGAALRLDPAFAAAHASLGEAYWRRFEQHRDRHWLLAASESCDRAVKLDPGLAAAHVCLGTIFNGTDRFEAGAAEFQLAADQEPTSDDAFRGLARSFEGLGDPQRALQAYRRAIDIRPTYWAGYNWLGAFYSDRGCYDKAVNEFTNALALSPGNARLLYNRGAVHAVSGRYNEALIDLTDSIALKPTSTAYLNLGTVHFRLLNFEAAAAAYERAAESAGTQFRVASSLAYGYYYWKPAWSSKGISTTRRAVDLGLRELALRPRDPVTHARLALLHALLGEPAAARRHLSGVDRGAGTTGVSAFLAAVAASHLGDRGAALGWLERAIALRYPLAEIRFAVEFRPLSGDPTFERMLRLAPPTIDPNFSCDAS